VHICRQFRLLIICADRSSRNSSRQEDGAYRNCFKQRFQSGLEWNEIVHGHVSRTGARAVPRVRLRIVRNFWRRRCGRVLSTNEVHADRLPNDRTARQARRYHRPIWPFRSYLHWKERRLAAYFRNTLHVGYNELNPITRSASTGVYTSWGQGEGGW